MLGIDLVYTLFAVPTVLAFAAFPVRPAILLVFLGGWTLLPVGHFPEDAAAAVFPWWVTGLAVPGEMLVNKAAVSSSYALFGAMLFDGPALRRWRPGLVDLPIAVWCAWPFISAQAAGHQSPPAWVSALYLSATWGALWLIGRVWFARPDDRIVVLKSLALAGLASLPFALLEATRPAWVHSLIYAEHPFGMDGAERYVGFRPMGFFEHGNQYGLWMALCAFSAIWLAAALRTKVGSALWTSLATVTTMAALASQSVGAIALLLMGLALLAVWPWRATLPLLTLAAAIGFVLVGLHFSGAVPLERIARETAIGAQILDTFRAFDRGSFLWRLSQDVKALGIIHTAPLAGTSTWDWWRPLETRPWGLTFLIAGQFGLIGLALAFLGPTLAAFQALWAARRTHVWTRESAALPLALLVLMTLADALLNAFLFFPALIAAGAIARPAPPEPSAT